MAMTSQERIGKARDVPWADGLKGAKRNFVIASPGSQRARVGGPTPLGFVAIQAGVTARRPWIASLRSQ